VHAVQLNYKYACNKIVLVAFHILGSKNYVLTIYPYYYKDRWLYFKCLQVTEMLEVDFMSIEAEF